MPDSNPTKPSTAEGGRAPMIIAVIGGGEPNARAMELAEEVGRELASRGATVVCGGLAGVMEAVCRGAKQAGGLTIGILPGSNPGDANPYVDVPICTGLGYARNVIVVKTGRAVIAIDGAFGTLSEIGHALGDGIPVIGLETWELAMDGKEESSIVRTGTAKEAVEKALEAAARRTKQERIRLH
jgi:uncharacterized protein (TIGR00725 family)